MSSDIPPSLNADSILYLVLKGLQGKVVVRLEHRQLLLPIIGLRDRLHPSLGSVFIISCVVVVVVGGRIAHDEVVATKLGVPVRQQRSGLHTHLVQRLVLPSQQYQIIFISALLRVLWKVGSFPWSFPFVQHFGILKIVLMVVLFLRNCVEVGLTMNHVMADVGLVPHVHEPTPNRRRHSKVLLRSKVFTLNAIAI